MAELEIQISADRIRHARPTPSETGERVESLRDRIVWDLRQQGYRFREIAELMGITKQRVSQIERRLIQRARSAPKKTRGLAAGPPRAIGKKEESRIRSVTSEEFNRRLDALNRSYENQLNRILARGYNRQRIHTRGHHRASTLFQKVWPLIELYELRPFSFSKLVGDFPSLARQPHLPQLLCRLRTRGQLRKLGSIRIEGHNLPEALIAEAPIEQYAAPCIEKLVVRWSRKLEQLRCSYSATRPAQSIQSLRQSLIQTLLDQGHPAVEIERVFGRNWNPPENYSIVPPKSGTGTHVRNVPDQGLPSHINH